MMDNTKVWCYTSLGVLWVALTTLYPVVMFFLTTGTVCMYLLVHTMVDYTLHRTPLYIRYPRTHKEK